jgi:urease accessory protein
MSMKKRRNFNLPVVIFIPGEPMHISFIRSFVALAAIAFCGVAQAHPGHLDHALAGFAHPLLGLDHLLAMVAVGIWAFQQGGRAKWLVPASFIVIMALAAGAGIAGISLPLVEGGIAMSLLLLGLLIAFSIRMTPALGAATVALFAIFHGYAHGAEIPSLATPWQYALEFLFSTAALHGVGLLLGRGLFTHKLLSRTASASVAAAGFWMMAAI